MPVERKILLDIRIRRNSRNQDCSFRPASRGDRSSSATWHLAQGCEARQHPREKLKPPYAMLTRFGCASNAIDTPYDSTDTVDYPAPGQVEGKPRDRAVGYWGCCMIGLEVVLKKPIGSRVVHGRFGLSSYREVPVHNKTRGWPDVCEAC
ncbi:hypothetical protein PEX1_084870 [Penicillium expansum]|nr:hypothetical protein PEX1_084870 [Penicillium expansum]